MDENDEPQCVGEETGIILAEAFYGWGWALKSKGRTLDQSTMKNLNREVALAQALTAAAKYGMTDPKIIEFGYH